MSFARYLLHDFWTAREFNRMEEDGARRARGQRRRQAEVTRKSAELERRVAELEDDLGRVTLLLRSLADVVVQKGVVTREELQQVATRLDAEDGEVDGRADPDRLAGMP